MKALPLAAFLDATNRVWNALFATATPFGVTDPDELELDEEIVHLHHCSGAWNEEALERHLERTAA